MTHFVKLTRPNGDKVWINPALVMTLDDIGEGMFAGTSISFALVGMADTDGSGTDHSPYVVRVTETPADVAGRMLSTAGPR